MDKKTIEMSIIPKLAPCDKTVSLTALGEPNLGLLAFTQSKTNLPTPGGGEGKGNVTQAQERVWAANKRRGLWGTSGKCF